MFNIYVNRLSGTTKRLEDDCLLEIDRRFRGAYCLHHRVTAYTRLQGATFHKTAIFILITART
jgi:hypothetical protein